MKATIVPLLFFLTLIILATLFIVTLYRTTQSIQEDNRLIQPWYTLLLFIPLFNVIWFVFIVNKLSLSISKEILSRGKELQEFRPTYGLGMITSIGWVIYFTIDLTGLSRYTPFYMFCGLLGIVCTITWIMYWIKVVKYKKLIALIAREQQP